MDFSTINREALLRLPTYNNLPDSCHLQDGSGNGCAGDPPGYPSYFTRCVYTKHGNGPSKGPVMVITVDDQNYVIHRAEEDWERVANVMRKLWLPLPLDHERSRLWIQDTHRRHANCYNGWSDDLIIYPVPYYKLKQFRDDERWSDTYRCSAVAEVQAFNDQVQQQYKSLATPENHNATRLIRKFYPDFQPDLDMINNPPSGIIPCWWESESVNPGPERCTQTQRNKGSSWSHPINGTWCQWCGWKAD